MGGTAEIWWIYFVPRCPHARPEPKDKLVVIVCRDGAPLGFLINSEIDPWIQINESKMASQVKIDASEHKPCLDHDSYVDCLELYMFEDYQLAQPRVRVSETVKSGIIAAVRASSTLVRRHKRLIAGG